MLKPSTRTKSVARRVMLSFAGVLVAFAVTVGYGVVAQNRAAADSELLRTGYVPLVLAVGAALENQNLITAQLNHIIEARNPSDARAWIETARRLRPKMFLDARATVERGFMPFGHGQARKIGSQAASELAQIETFLSDDGAALSKLFEALSAGNLQQAEQNRATLLAHEAEGARRLRELKSRVDHEMEALTSLNRQRERTSLASLAMLACLTMAVGVAMTLHARRVLAPLGAVTSRAKMVARGDMTPHPVTTSGDEIGELATTFEWMVEAIAKANEDRLQAERLAVVGRMAAHVTHEIRNPLSSIGLNLEMLEEELASGDSNPESRQLLRAIRREVDHLSDLSEEYLSLARKPQPRLEREQLGDIVAESTSFLDAELRKASISLRLDIQQAPPVMADEAQLRQAIGNLVRNAREAMSQGGSITIGLRVAEPGMVELTVDDTGAGVPEAVRQSIFDPFFTTKNRGTGLGLAVTKQLIQAHGGTISCESLAAGGTRFRIILPSCSDN